LEPQHLVASGGIPGYRPGSGPVIPGLIQIAKPPRTAHQTRGQIRG